MKKLLLIALVAGGLNLCCGATFRCSSFLQHWVRTGLLRRILPLRLLLSVSVLLSAVLGLLLLPAVLLVRRTPLLPPPSSPPLLPTLR